MRANARGVLIQRRQERSSACDNAMVALLLSE